MKHSLSLFVAGLMLAVAAPAFAHAYPQKEAPAKGAVVHAAPKTVAIWFDDELQAGLSWLKVSDDGKVVSVGKGKVDAKNRKLLSVALAKAGTGKYSVEWHALSVDGHPTSGAYSFTVAPASKKPMVPMPLDKRGLMMPKNGKK
ncbi:MAG TPA: copper resistance CopC family protein [Oscillatoriaceae cyanobacterium]